MRVTLTSCTAMLLLVGNACLAGQTNLLRNGDFTDGAKGWNGPGSDDGKHVALEDLPDGTKALRLERRKEGAGVAIDQDVRLKPQTLYKLSAIGWGDAAAALRLRPFASKDKNFNNLSKCWATSTAPFEAAKAPKTMEFVFDSGRKVDRATISVYLSDTKQIGAFHLRSIRLTAIGSAKPGKDEQIIVHFGDSVTITSYLPFHQRVHRVLAGMIAKELPKVKARQINTAADGEYVKDLVDSKRYDKIIRDQYERIDIAVIRYGANDSRFGPADHFKNRLADLCARLKKDYPGITIVLGTGPYIHEADYANTTQYGKYWQATRDLAKAEGYPLVDVFKRFEKEQSHKLSRQPGDAHPSPLGVRVTAEEEFKVLRPILAAKAATASAPAKGVSR